MHTFAINIGLAIPGSTEQMLSGPVLALLKSRFSVLDHAVIQSDTEPTISAVCAAYDDNLGAIVDAVNVICIALGQEAIALFFKDWGQLVGPKAAEWGPFNPAYFVTTGGARLSDILGITP